VNDREATSSEELIRQARESLEREPEMPEPEPEADFGSDHTAVEPQIEVEDLVQQTREPPEGEPDMPEPELGGDHIEFESPMEVEDVASPRDRARGPRLGPPGEYLPPERPQSVLDEVPDFRRGLFLAVAAAVVGALAWALLLAYADIKSWLLGIAIGWLVGTAAIRGAGRFDDRLKVTVALLTLGAVVVGEFLGVALALNKEFGFFDLPLAIEFYMNNLDEFGGEAFFSLVGGALGAWTAVSQSQRSQK
jgi:hypothetical protein